MRKITFLLVLLVMAISSVFAQGNDYYEKFTLSQSLADKLKMTDPQIDAVGERDGTLSRHWSKAVLAIADIDDQIEALQNDSKKSPVMIGGQAGALIQQRVELGRKIINEVVVNFNGNLALLTKEQVALVNGLEDKMKDAEKAYEMFYDARSANFILVDYRVASLPHPYYSCSECGGGGGAGAAAEMATSAEETLIMRLNSDIADDVAQFKQKRTTERKAAATNAIRESQRAKTSTSRQ